MAIAATHVATSTGHGTFPPTTSEGGSSTLTVEGNPVILVGQTFVPHKDNKGNIHQPVVADGSDFFTVDGIPVALIGSSLGCGDSIASGATTLLTIG